MKIAIRGGHNPQAPGARALIDELTEDRKVKDAVIKYLRQAGHEVLDVTPGNCDVNTDLKLGVNKANEWGADFFASIHFNKAYDSYKGAIGSECWTIGPGHAANVAKRIVDSMCKAGFKNRGVKHRGLYELRHTRMSAVIVEVCFVEATEDVQAYTRAGADAIGKYIAEGINGAEIKPQDVTSPIYRVKVDGKQLGAYKEPTNVINQLKNNWGKVEKIEIERK